MLVLGLLKSLQTLTIRCLTLALVVMLIPLSACNPGSLLASDTSSQLVETILSDPKTFNPVIASDATSSGVGARIFEGLVSENPITGEIEPALAESWEISEDKLEVIHTLRPNLKWSDGKPLTADDVVFTYNQLYTNPDVPTGMKDILKIGQSKQFPTVTKLNDRQVKFTTPEPFAPFLGITGAAIYPAHALRQGVEEKDQDGQLKFLSMWSVDTPTEKIPASGAYKLDSYSTSQRVVFVENPYYWKKAAVDQNIPYIKKVIWEIVESTDTSLTQFRSGSLDAIAVSPEYFSLLKKEEEKGNFEIKQGGEVYSMTFIAFNLNQGKRDGKPVINPNKSAWFNNVKFRQAVSYGINRDRMIKNIYRGLGQPQKSYMARQSPFYDDSVEGYPYNPQQAKQILLEAGFKYNQRNQLLDQQGDRVQFTLNTNTGNKIREALCDQIADDLAKIGIKVNFRAINFNVILDKLDSTFNWDCILISFTGGNEPNGGYNFWSTEGNSHLFNQKPTPDKKPLEGRVVADWEAEIDRLYIEAARELDENKRKAIYAEVQQIVAEKLPVICLVNPYSMAAVRNKIEGVEYSALGGAFWNLDELKIAE